MTPYALASPPVGAPSGVTMWRGLSLTWEGPSGERWDFTRRAGGILLTAQGLEGLHNPRITKFSSTSRGVPGNRPRGWRAEAREVFWPIFVWADGSDAWAERMGRFFDSIHPENPGVWRADTGRQVRSLRCTGVFDITHKYSYDPFRTGWQLYGVELEAHQPFWEGEPIERGPWQSANSKPFFGGPPLYISSSSTFGGADIPNPGDVDAYGTWELRGPLSDTTLGVGEIRNVIPFPLNDDDLLVINTDPRNPSATLNGADVTEDLGLQRWAPVPPGESVPLYVSAVGMGSIRFRHTPLFFRAF